MRVGEYIEASWNLEIDVIDSGNRTLWHQRTHNIFVNTGRQYLADTITASAFAAGSGFTRKADEVVRYIGFGIGGSRQNSPVAAGPPYTVDYAGTNTQADTDVTVGILERPVRVSATDWVKQVATGTPPPDATSSMFVTTFAQNDVNYDPAYPSVPLSEIGLFTSGADPALANGVGGGYPGVGGTMIAYDTFDTIHKTSFTIEVRWTLKF